MDEPVRLQKLLSGRPRFRVRRRRSAFDAHRQHVAVLRRHLLTAAGWKRSRGRFVLERQLVGDRLLLTRVLQPFDLEETRKTEVDARLIGTGTGKGFAPGTLIARDWQAWHQRDFRLQRFAVLVDVILRRREWCAAVAVHRLLHLHREEFAFLLVEQCRFLGTETGVGDDDDLIDAGVKRLGLADFILLERLGPHLLIELGEPDDVVAPFERLLLLVAERVEGEFHLVAFKPTFGDDVFARLPQRGIERVQPAVVGFVGDEFDLHFDLVVESLHFETLFGGRPPYGLLVGFDFVDDRVSIADFRLRPCRAIPTIHERRRGRPPGKSRPAPAERETANGNGSRSASRNILAKVQMRLNFIRVASELARSKGRASSPANEQRSLTNMSPYDGTSDDFAFGGPPS